MASTAARAALARAVALLPAHDRNILTQHGRFGVSAVMDFLKADREKADAELARIKDKLAPMVQRELKRPPELPASSSLRGPERSTLPDRPLLRTRGEISASTPPKRKVGNYKPKPCRDCGQDFKPAAPRQVKCDECRGVAPVVVRQDPEIVRAPPPAEPRPVEEAALDAAGVEPPGTEEKPDPPRATRRRAPASSNGNGHGTGAQYLRLRDELRAIQGRIDNLAADFDRLIEDQHTTRAGGRSDDP